MVQVPRLELGRGTHQILSLARLPIPPYLQEIAFSFNEVLILSLFLYYVNYIDMLAGIKAKDF